MRSKFSKRSKARTYVGLLLTISFVLNYEKVGDSMAVSHDANTNSFLSDSFFFTLQHFSFHLRV